MSNVRKAKNDYVVVYSFLNTTTVLNLKQNYSFPFYSSEQNIFSAGNMALYKWLLG